MQDNNKTTLVAPLPTPPRTQLGELREVLTIIEKRLAKLKEINAEEALEILTLFDQASERLATLETAGVGPSSEVSHLESLLMQFRKRSPLFLRRAGGPSAIRQARQDHSPDEDHWWWFIDETLARERKSTLIRGAAGFLVLVIVLAGVTFIYQRFLAPDPAFTASYGLYQDAEAALIQGDPELALANINEALTNTPNDPELYLMRGITYLALDDPEAAEENFEIARERFESEEFFYIKRAGLYVILGRPDLAIEDADLAIERNPDMAYAYIYRGQAHETLGDLDRAIADYELANEIAERNNNPEIQVVARLHLAQIMQQVGFPTTETP
jgi:tetratricopeptide (TPR) repeat protein